MDTTDASADKMSFAADLVDVLTGDLYAALREGTFPRGELMAEISRRELAAARMADMKTEDLYAALREGTFPRGELNAEISRRELATLRNE